MALQAAALTPEERIALVEAQVEREREEAERKAAALATPEGMAVKAEALSVICQVFPGAPNCP